MINNLINGFQIIILFDETTEDYSWRKKKLLTKISITLKS